MASKKGRKARLPTSSRLAPLNRALDKITSYGPSKGRLPGGSPPPEPEKDTEESEQEG